MGATSPRVSLLLSSGLNDEFDIGDDHKSRAAQASREADGTLLLWIATERALHVLTWPTDASPASRSIACFPIRAWTGCGWPLPTSTPMAITTS